MSKSKENPKSDAANNTGSPPLPEQPMHEKYAIEPANTGQVPIAPEDEMLETMLATDGATRPNQSAGPPAPGQPIVPGPRVVESIRRFKWTALVIAIVVAALLIPGIWIWYAPMYRARAEVRVRPIIPYLVFRTEESGTIPLYDSFVNTQVPIISSTPVLQRVLDDERLRQTQWHAKPSQSLVQKMLGETTTPMERIEEDLAASPRKDTEIIDVSFKASNPQDAKLILNTILDHYVRYIAEMSDATEDKVYRQLTEQYASLESEILGREKIIDGLHTALGTAIPEELVSNQRVRLDETQAHLAQVQQSITLLQWELDSLNAQDSNGTWSLGDNQKQPEYYEDEQWNKLDVDRKQIQYEIETAATGPHHPDTIRAEKQLRLVKEMLREREAQLDEIWSNREVPLQVTITAGTQLNYDEAVAYLEQQLGRAKHEEQLVLASLQKQMTEFDKLFESAQQLDKENVTLKHRRELYDAVRQRLDQKNMERNAPGSIEIMTAAVTEPNPHNDHRIVFTLMASILALCAGGGVAFLRGSRSEFIYTPEDMPYPMQIPFLGQVPRIRSARAANGQAGPTMIESIRVVRTALLSRLSGRKGAAILITSAVSGTGKSHFSMMLGESLARSGKKVLLIDADLRKMTLTKQLDLCDKSGFIQSLSRGSASKHYIFKIGQTPGMSFMPAGIHDENREAFEQIVTEDFKSYIDQLRKLYDIILLDSTPVLPVADATILSNQVDGTIMVERELVSQRTDEIEAFSRLKTSGGHLIGTVFVGSARHSAYA